MAYLILILQFLLRAGSCISDYYMQSIFQIFKKKNQKYLTIQFTTASHSNFKECISKVIRFVRHDPALNSANFSSLFTYILIFLQPNDIISSKIMPCDDSLSETCSESRLNNTDNVSRVNEHIKNLNQGKNKVVVFSIPFFNK